MTRKNSGDGYKVGFGKPPETARFKPGTSGNPSGRPKGSKNRMPTPDELSRMVFDEALRLVPVKEHGKVKSMQTARAITRSVNHKAANGDVRAQKLAFDQMIAAQDKLSANHDQVFTAAWEYKKQWAEDSKWRRQRGLPDPEVFPHPDDVLLNFETREVTVVGLTSDQQELIDGLLDAKKFYETALCEILKEKHNSEDHDWVMDDVDFCVHMLKQISKALGSSLGRKFHSRAGSEKAA
jgi:hypothetical protein